MSGLVAPDAVVSVLDAIRTQIDVITTVSSGGFGVIIFTWARVLGIFDDADFSAFKRPTLLVLPALCFILAIIVGYLAGAQTTGYYTEIASGIDTSTDTKISDARKYFFGSYDTRFYWMMAVQLYASVTGILILSCWFAWNVFSMTRSKQNEQH